MSQQDNECPPPLFDPPTRRRPLSHQTGRAGGLGPYISSLSLLKMLKHGRAGVPMEVMGLMLGQFIDDYTVRIVHTG